ncbi:MAG: hypothetical protein IAB75_03445 [Bacteroidetes bacterium]|uniref:Uncharacterized protein n=1 Tax=Candidatus Cryptobacteroides avicola TaxID=2840757 RepID=A0A940DST6_9BACT|nr:hypothetical protein [Candidatus Cryptobacteroides avicola]
MNKNLWILLIILALITPIILNIIIGSTNPLDSIEIVGKEDDWLGFYGSYIGGVLAAIVAFMTMWQSSKHNTLNVMIQQQEAYIKEMNNTLAERISKLDFWYIGSISLHAPEKEKEEFYMRVLSEIDKLNDLSKDISRLYNAYGMLHSQTQNIAEKDFNEFYEICVKQYKRRIDEMTRMLTTVKNGRDTEEHNKIYQSFRSDLADFNLKLADDKEHYTDVLFKKANSIIQAEEKKLEKLNREKKKIFPKIPQ